MSKEIWCGWLLLTCLVASERSAATPAHGNEADQGIRLSYKTCLDASGGATFALQACVETEYTYQDKRLNKVYKELMSELSPTARTKLLAAEKGWITYRDNYCWPDPEVGRSGLINASSCAVDETARRASQLEAQHELELLKK